MLEITPKEEYVFKYEDKKFGLTTFDCNGKDFWFCWEVGKALGYSKGGRNFETFLVSHLIELVEGVHYYPFLREDMPRLRGLLRRKGTPWTNRTADVMENRSRKQKAYFVSLEGIRILSNKAIKRKGVIEAFLQDIDGVHSAENMELEGLTEEELSEQVEELLVDTGELQKERREVVSSRELRRRMRSRNRKNSRDHAGRWQYLYATTLSKEIRADDTICLDMHPLDICFLAEALKLLRYDKIERTTIPIEGLTQVNERGWVAYSAKAVEQIKEELRSFDLEAYDNGEVALPKWVSERSFIKEGF